jgi:hypothetical protein
MKVILCFLLLITGFRGVSQQITNSVSVNHYAHPELYMKAGVVCFITDRQGNPSRDGSYLFINNRSSSAFYFNRPGANKDWKELRPRQKILIPLKNAGKSTVVPLRVKYTKTPGSDLKEKANDLKILNGISARSSYSKASEQTSTPKASGSTIKKDVAVAEVKKSKKAAPPNTSTTKTTKAPATHSQTPLKKTAEITVVPVKSRCMYTSSPAYYTFYYLKVNKEVFYSDVFPVAAYDNTTEGEELLAQAWNCFLNGLRTKYSGERLQKLLNDPDNDLHLGLMHLRNPFIPSNNVVKISPYTASAKSAKQELSQWIKDDKRTYPGLIFINIDL